MPRYSGYSNATDDGHEHDPQPYDEIETPFGELAYECGRCGLRGDAHPPMAAIEPYIAWETNPPPGIEEEGDGDAE